MIIEEILEVIPTPKDQVLYLGDSDVDMLTAKNAGIIGCGVSWGFRAEEELAKHKPDHLIHHPKEILEVIESYNN